MRIRLRWRRHGELDSCPESRVKRRLTVAYGWEPKLCAQAATPGDTFGWLRLAAADGLATSAVQ
jgi:hypothetical protein